MEIGLVVSILSPEYVALMHRVALAGKRDWKRIALRVILLDVLLNFVGVAVGTLYLLAAFMQALNNGTANPIGVEYKIMLPTSFGLILVGILLKKFSSDVIIQIRKEDCKGCWKMVCRRAYTTALTTIILITMAGFILIRFPLADEIFQTEFYFQYFKLVALYMGLSSIGGLCLIVAMVLCIKQFHYKEAFLEQLVTMTI